MTRIDLRESVPEAPKKTGNRWRVIVARPGKGSSGVYSEELFRRDAEKIIAPGGQMFINHGTDRNPKDMLGTYPEGSFWDEDEKAVVAEVDIFSHWKEFVEEVGPHCGASLFALGESDEEGNVTAIIEDRMNGADLVARPGLVGSGLAGKLYESAIAGSEENPGTRREDKENKMDKETLEAALKPLADALAVLVTEKKAAEAADAQAVADEAAVASAVEAYDAKVAAIAAADLPEVQAESLRAAAKAGQDVAPLIESAKTLKAAIEADLRESADEAGAQGRILGGRQVESATELGKVFG